MLKIDEIIALPVNSIEHDACIIDEKPGHLMLAVRIPRSFIASNHALMMALSERATDAPASIAPRPTIIPPRQASAPKPFVWAALTACVAVSVLVPMALPTISMANLPPPVEYRAWRVAKPSFAVGENIELIVSYKRDRECSTAFDRHISRASDGATVYTSRQFGGISRANSEFTDFHVILTVSLPPGDYIYRGLTHSECGKGGGYDLPHPDLAFSVK